MLGFASQVVQPGSIASLESAAAWRWAEAELLQERGRLGAALYLFGFTAEFRLTAAMLHLLGFGSHDAVDRRRLDDFHRAARRLHLMSTEPHDLVGLSRYVLHLRRELALPTAKRVMLAILQAAADTYDHWRAGLRYKPITPSAAQLNIARAGANWLREHYNEVWR